jgi:hypothetical protein
MERVERVSSKLRHGPDAARFVPGKKRPNPFRLNYADFFSIELCDLPLLASD